MSYSTTGSSIVYNGDGLDLTFAIPFSFVESAQILAQLFDVTDPQNPVEIPIVKDTDYSIVGTDVVFVVAPPVDHQVIVYRLTPATHPTGYNTYEFPFDTMNNDLDRLSQAVQEMQNDFTRVLFAQTLLQQLNGDPLPDWSTLGTDVDQLQTDVLALQTAVTTLQGQMTSAQTDITTLQGQMTTAQTNITNLQTAVTTLQGQMASALSDISTLQGQVGLLAFSSQAENANFNAAYNKIHICTGNISAQLPAPSLDKVIRFKAVGASQITLVRNGGENIDGVAADLALTSEDEAVTLLSDGTDWWLI